MGSDAVTPKVDTVEDIVPSEKGQPEPQRRDEATEKRIRRAFDIRVLPMGTFIYLLSFIDRANMGNAKILGIVEDNNLTGNRYNIILTVFYISYIIFEMYAHVTLHNRLSRRCSLGRSQLTSLVLPIWHASTLVPKYGSLSSPSASA